MVLWIVFAGLTCAALVTVLWPFLRRGQGGDPGAYDTAVFKDQLAEIASEEERGVISKEEAEAAHIEVSRRLLAAAKAGERNDQGAAQTPEKNRTPALALICAVAFVPVTASALYLVYGSPGLPDQPLSARLAPSGAEQSVAVLVAKVEARLRDHPMDGRGWEVIAPVYMRQQRFDDAADALGKALRLLGETPERLENFGNALVLANEGVVTEPARKALQKAVTQDASLIRAHFWLAVAREQDGRFADAAQAWRDLLKRGAATAPWRAAVEERLALAEKRAGLEPVEDVDTARREPAEKATPGPSSEDVAAARNMSEEDRARMIAQMVAGLAERLKNSGGSVEEWQRLVRSYSVLGDKRAASKALAEARNAFANDPGALASLDGLANSLGL